MPRIWAAVLVCGLATIDAKAQFWQFIQRSPEPIIGLLDLPDIVGQGCGALQKRATSALFHVPSESSAGAGILYWQDEGNAGCWLRVKQSGS